MRIEGREIPVEPAWVLSAPPNYAPDVLGVRTLYDLLLDLYVGAGWMQRPATPSFRHDVYPILHRLSRLQWVNKGFATQFGRGGPHDFEDPAYVARLARDPATDGFDMFAELRAQVLLSFRPPDPVGRQSTAVAVDLRRRDGRAGRRRRRGRTRRSAATQFAVLQAWAAGRFAADWTPPFNVPASIDDLPLAERPAMLDRAALEHCLADAFHPGCEVTWPVRHLTMYSSPFRIRHRRGRHAAAVLWHDADDSGSARPDRAVVRTGPR